VGENWNGQCIGMHRLEDTRAKNIVYQTIQKQHRSINFVLNHACNTQSRIEDERHP
jgi:hypothetical protein